MDRRVFREDYIAFIRNHSDKAERTRSDHQSTFQGGLREIGSWRVDRVLDFVFDNYDDPVSFNNIRTYFPTGESLDYDPCSSFYFVIPELLPSYLGDGG